MTFISPPNVYFLFQAQKVKNNYVPNDFVVESNRTMPVTLVKDGLKVKFTPAWRLKS